MYGLGKIVFRIEDNSKVNITRKDSLSFFLSFYLTIKDKQIELYENLVQAPAAQEKGILVVLPTVLVTLLVWVSLAVYVCSENVVGAVW